ncbi:MAG: nucleotidyltransferase domain-containing protein, partial [Bauldia sp.]
MSDTEILLSRDIDRDQLIAELRALRPAFEREGVTHMALIGSRARRDNRADSDIDLAIEVSDEKQRFSLLDLIGVKHVVEDTLALRADIFMLRSLEPELLKNAQRDRVEVF